jgi:DNA-binding NarL/FixJ family response regulator
VADSASAACVIVPDEVLAARIVAALACDGIEVLATAGPALAERLLDGVAREPDLVVVALEGGERSSFRIIRELRMRFSGVALVAIAVSEDEAVRRRLVRGALRAGVDGLVPGERLDSTLGPVARAVLADLVVVPRGERALLTPALSHRERQVLALVVAGYANSQVADRLYLAESTVKSHLTSAFAKLGVSSRGEATSLILDPQEPVGRAVLNAIRPEFEPEPADGTTWR